MSKDKFSNAEFIYSELIDNHFQGILAIDLKGIVFFCNQFFLNILGINESDIVGKEIKSVIPNCRLQDTIVQQCSNWGEVLKINSKEIVIARYPIKSNGVIVGAVLKTIFPDMNTAREVSAKLSNSYCNVNYYSNLHTCMDIIGESESMLLVKKLARRASRSISNLLVTGESGTGKTIMVEAIHNRSVRRENSFVKVNCAAIPENLLESELFGYEEGAFTGASKRGKPGKFELANGGTLFLDEIGDMPLYMQAKVLQAIQDKRVERVGGNVPIDLDVRIIAATNRDLEKLISENKFREDLYYRLKVLEIRMPSLREIPEDIPGYVNGLIKNINRKLGSDIKGFTDESMEIIKSYHWPGNVRQLENFLEQAVNYSDDSIIDVNKLHVKPWENDEEFKLTNMPVDNTNIDKNFNNIIYKTEKDIIMEAIKKCNGNKTKAAQVLNIHRSVLYKKIKRLNIEI